MPKRVKIFFLFITALTIQSLGVESLPKNLFVELGKKVNPSVVNISTSQVIRMRGGPGFMMDPFFGPFMDPWGLYGDGGNPPVQKASSLGSGFIIDASGLIVTNNHVVRNANQIEVQLTEKSKPIKAKVVGQDARIDVALLKIDVTQKLVPISLGNSDKVEVGEWVAAFGNPFGHGHSMTKGIISAKERDIEAPDAPYFPYLQTDASINPGNSGGPLVNTEGEVIGVNTAIDARAQGIGFAIPINEVKKVLNDLKTKGRVERGFLGVGVDNLDERMAKQLGLPNSEGAFVVNVAPNSAAQRAGIKPYDVITEINGSSIKNSRDLTKEIARKNIGESVKIKLFRDGKPKTLTATIGRPEDEMSPTAPKSHAIPSRGLAVPSVGLSLVDLTRQLSRELRVPPEIRGGAVVVEVKDGSPADQAGFQPGDVIIDVNKTPVSNARQAVNEFKKSRNIVKAYRAGRTFFVFM